MYKWCILDSNWFCETFSLLAAILLLKLRLLFHSDIFDNELDDNCICKSDKLT